MVVAVQQPEDTINIDRPRPYKYGEPKGIEAAIALLMHTGCAQVACAVNGIVF